MKNVLTHAFQVLLEWILPATFTVVGAWIAIKRKKLAAWHASRRDRRQAIYDMPNAVRDLSHKLDAASAAGVRMTTEFKAINEKLDAQTETQRHHTEVMADIMAVAYGQMEHSPIPQFVCDNDGRNRLVNMAFARLVRCGRDELRDFAYHSFINPSLNPHYFESFVDATRQHRIFEADLILSRPDGTHCLVRVRALPHPGDRPPATHWNGSLMYVKEYGE